MLLKMLHNFIFLNISLLFNTSWDIKILLETHVKETNAQFR